MAAQYSPPRSGGEYFAEFKFLHTFHRPLLQQKPDNAANIQKTDQCHFALDDIRRSLRCGGCGLGLGVRRLFAVRQRRMDTFRSTGPIQP